MATFITRLDQAGSGPRLAVKDLIDIAGLPTTAGSRALAEIARPAARDAACMSGARAADAVIVGKANLHELAFGASGVNDWFGTPVNPLDPELVPGGSSSGSAVAVAVGDADLGYGSDTGGSIRVPAAYCGIAGLKTTHGRFPLDGVWPLAPSLDTVGPMARDVAGLRAGMELLEPGFGSAAGPAVQLGRLRPAGLRIDPRIEAAVDSAIAVSGLPIADVALPGWRAARRAVSFIIDVEAAIANAELIHDPVSRAKLSGRVRDALDDALQVSAADVRWARDYQRNWRAAWQRLFGQAEVLVLATTPDFPPPLAEPNRVKHTACTAPVNLAGLPALALPVPSEHRLPASLQLIGPAGSEDLLLATGTVIEAAAGYLR